MEIGRGTLTIHTPLDRYDLPGGVDQSASRVTQFSPGIAATETRTTSVTLIFLW